MREGEATEEVGGLALLGHHLPPDFCSFSSGSLWVGVTLGGCPQVQSEPCPQHPTLPLLPHPLPAFLQDGIQVKELTASVRTSTERNSDLRADNKQKEHVNR